MTLWKYEFLLLLRTRLALVALLLLPLLTALAIGLGLAEIQRQNRAIAAIAKPQAEDIGAIAHWVVKTGDPGNAAYYSFHPTWDAPSPLAFAAIGMRDVSPYILRVRALGLEAQIHDGDIFNPELALPGRFDFAFVLVFLAPLFVIALFHDLHSGEREAGRARMLGALPHARMLWARRAALRFMVLFGGLVTPFLIGAIISGATLPATLAVLALTAAYLLFWLALTLLVSRMRWSSASNAATLAATWIVLVLVLPTLSHVVINQSIPVNQGAEIALAQREKVNRAWDIPREETMRRFYATHPQWADSPPLPQEFHYKWYLAFHQVGDESVADQVRAYREGIEGRDRAARILGWILPSVGVQAHLTWLAKTDLTAQLAYQDRIRAYHKRLREFYYGYLFRDKPFGAGDFAATPTFSG